MPTTHNFNDIVRQYQKFKRKLPRIIGNEAVNFAKENFRKQGFDDGSVKKWKARKPNAQRNQGRAILTDTGRLRRSIRITKVAGNRIYIGSNVPYAQIHNEGGKIVKRVRVRRHSRRTRAQGRITVGAHRRRMNTKIPKREFIGPSKTLNRRIKKTIQKQLLKIFT